MSVESKCTLKETQRVPVSESRVLIQYVNKSLLTPEDIKCFTEGPRVPEIAEHIGDVISIKPREFELIISFERLKEAEYFIELNNGVEYFRNKEEKRGMILSVTLVI